MSTPSPCTPPTPALQAARAEQCFTQRRPPPNETGFAPPGSREVFLPHHTISDLVKIGKSIMSMAVVCSGAETKRVRKPVPSWSGRTAGRRLRLPALLPGRLDGLT